MTNGSQTARETGISRHENRCPLKPLNTLECCVMYGGFQERFVLNWAHMIAERRQPLRQQM